MSIRAAHTTTFRLRRWRWRWLVAVTALVAALAVWVSSHMPDDDASPEQVVLAYANALHWRDCITAARLAPNDGRTWCGTDITDVRVTHSGMDRRDRGDGARDYYVVDVQMNLKFTDGSLNDGPNGWGYTLDRVGPNGAWRIVGQGNG